MPASAATRWSGPPEYSPQKPFPGGPSSAMRIERDVLSLSGVTAMIWLEGINDFSKNGNASVQAVQDRMKEVIARIRAKIPGIRIFGATVADRAERDQRGARLCRSRTRSARR